MKKHAAVRRRQVLRRGFAVATVAAAGCQSLSEPVSDGTETTTQMPEATPRLETHGEVGLATQTDPNEIGGVALTVRPTSDVAPIDLTGVAIQWVDTTGTYDLVHERVYDGDADSAFAHTPWNQDTETPTADNSAVLDGTDDTAILYIDLGASESAAGADNDVASAYQTTLTDAEVIRDRGLEEGETATLYLITADGPQTEVRLTVPETCTCVPPIQL